MSRAADLIQVAELIRLAAKTATTLVGDITTNGSLPEIVDAIQRIEAAADDLTKAGQRWDDDDVI